MSHPIRLLIDLDAYRANTMDTFTGRHPSREGVRESLRRMGMVPDADGWWRADSGEVLYRFDVREVVDAVSEVSFGQNATVKTSPQLGVGGG